LPLSLAPYTPVANVENLASVFGSADTKYLEAQTDDRSKRRAIGVYASSGLSNYLDPEAEKSMPYGNASLLVPNADEHFPTNVR
jgi:hypothetical protein